MIQVIPNFETDRDFNFAIISKDKNVYTNLEDMVFDIQQEYFPDPIQMITADGNELIMITDWIKSNNLSIPYINDECTWRGDLANFIFDNFFKY